MDNVRCLQLLIGIRLSARTKTLCSPLQLAHTSEWSLGVHVLLPSRFLPVYLPLHATRLPSGDDVNCPELWNPELIACHVFLNKRVSPLGIFQPIRVLPSTLEFEPV